MQYRPDLPVHERLPGHIPYRCNGARARRVEGWILGNSEDLKGLALLLSSAASGWIIGQTAAIHGVMTAQDATAASWK